MVPSSPDFVCPAARLVIEIDGDQHAKTAGYDAARTHYLEKLGYHVVRFSTHEVLHRMADVLARAHLAIEKRLAELGDG